ncbi:MAG: DUF2520 domain-containing protein [Thermoleophilaceae bacterium]
MDPIAADIHMTPSARAVPESIGILGAGRVGTALAAALRAAGVSVHGPAGRDEPLPPCDAVLLCVPDGAIAAAAEAVAGAAPLTGHTSGATPLTALAAAGGELFGLHPLQTVTGDGATLAGAGCAIAGTTTDALDLAQRLALVLGMTPFEIADEDRAAYHAAASIASNFLVTLEAAAERVAASAGVDRKLLAPLVRATVENWAAVGAERALTGPVARGDDATVARQREAIPDDLLPLFDALVEATRDLAGVRA